MSVIFTGQPAFSAKGWFSPYASPSGWYNKELSDVYAPPVPPQPAPAPEDRAPIPIGGDTTGRRKRLIPLATPDGRLVASSVTFDADAENEQDMEILEDMIRIVSLWVTRL